MDAIGDILAGIVELFVRALYGVIRLIIWVIGFALSQTWLVNHFGAMRSFGLMLIWLSGLYLLFGIVRANVEALWTPALSPIYQWQVLALMFVVLLVGIALRELKAETYGVDPTRHRFEPETLNAPPAQTGPIQTQTNHSARFVAGLVLVAIVIAVISAFTSERHEATLADKLCAQAEARISQGVEDAVRDGAGFLDRVLGTQTADAIPCGEP